MPCNEDQTFSNLKQGKANKYLASVFLTEKEPRCRAVSRVDGTSQSEIEKQIKNCLFHSPPGPGSSGTHLTLLHRRSYPINMPATPASEAPPTAARWVLNFQSGAASGAVERAHASSLGLSLHPSQMTPLYLLRITPKIYQVFTKAELSLE